MDAVVILTPVMLHRDHAVIAAQMGKHILLEKPMAHTSGECQEIIEACKTRRSMPAGWLQQEVHPAEQGCVVDLEPYLSHKTNAS